VVAKVRNVQRIVSLTASARALGLRHGEALADARARAPSLLAEEAEPDLDAALLGFIADWCDRYTPLVALDGEDGLLLDLTGCAHLFGGEEALLTDILARLEGQGFAVRGAIADTPGAAWAMARYGEEACIPPGGQGMALAGLPLAALRLDVNVIDGLERVGLTRVGDIVSRPRAPLAGRFGPELVRRLDQALGAEGEPISPRFAAPLIVAERRFFEPIGRLEDVRAVALSLAGQVCEALERRVEGGGPSSLPSSGSTARCRRLSSAPVARSGTRSGSWRFSPKS
jgi:protein ImuB